MGAQPSTSAGVSGMPSSSTLLQEVNASTAANARMERRIMWVRYRIKSEGWRQGHNLCPSPFDTRQRHAKQRWNGSDSYFLSCRCRKTRDQLPILGRLQKISG